jgi:prepilin peptidase CpaA
LTGDLPTLTLWVLVGLAAGWDVAQRRIPNALILTGLLLGAALRTQAGGLAGLGSCVGGAAVALALLFLPFRARLMGGGDVKLAMVCGAFLGWRGAVEVILVGTVIHGCVVVGILAWRWLQLRRGRPAGPKRGVPHAVGFALAVVALGASGVHLLPGPR